jgi:hypothetical protein
MKAYILSVLFLCTTSLVAQAPAAATPQPHSSDLGFTYNIPSDWEVLATSTLSSLQQETAKSTAGEDVKKGVGCAQISLTARHGDPASMIAVMTLSNACVGQAVTEEDMPGVVAAALEGPSQGFDMTQPEFGSYKLGTHTIWIGRAQGAPKGQPALKYAEETACTLLEKGAACWLIMAADHAATDTFERGLVTLEKDKPIALVPANAFEKKLN